VRNQLLSLLSDDEDLTRRLLAIRNFSKTVRSAEYHLTNACNIRCKGCWFFEYGFERATREERSLDRWKEFAKEESRRGVAAALLIGGEPTLYRDRIEAFVEAMPFVTISTNGIKPLPRDGFDNVTVAVSLFGGGPLDDDLRGHTPAGRSRTGLFRQALDNYKADDRTIFIYALTSDSLPYLEQTVRLVADNGNRITFNYYVPYAMGVESPAALPDRELLDAALRAAENYPKAVACHPYFIEALILGETPFGKFDYEVCPSISVDHPAHRERLRNGNPVLPGFNAWAADTKTLNFCCTSGKCSSCRDSQAVYSWLMVSLQHFLGSKEELNVWVEIAESYWSQFVWSPYHPRSLAKAESGPVPK
jgi:MoaA/NifB/PqqE/SkfB family radical SAM enzyme